MDTKTDARGIEYVEAGATLESLPAGWALCGTCHRAWNDAAPTSWTPAPSGRCPFEYDHDEEPDDEREAVELELEFLHDEQPDEDPDLSWLEQTPEQIGAAAAAANAERLAAYRRDEWQMIGVRAVAVITISRDGYVDRRLELTSAGVWGIESDSERTYLRETSREQAPELEPELLALGFNRETIAEAIRDEWPPA